MDPKALDMVGTRVGIVDRVGCEYVAADTQTSNAGQLTRAKEFAGRFIGGIREHVRGCRRVR